MNEYHYLSKHLCSVNTYDKKEKLRYSLLIQSHIIEKGLSLDDVRLGFGVPKIRRLLCDLKEFNKQYGDQRLLYYVLSIVKQYISFHQEQNYDVDNVIIEDFNQLYQQLDSGNLNLYQETGGGTIEMNKSGYQDESFQYGAFVKSRHSIRSFTGGTVPHEVIRRALEIAEATPSACNRQPWDIYVRTHKEDIIRILDIQSGARQFKEKVSALIVIGSTVNAFSITEGHQPYVNGGLYAMNLMLAFHSLGIGCIPLNMGIGISEINRIKRVLEMPDENIPVLLLAIGQVPEHFKVACSERFPFSEYTHFD